MHLTIDGFGANRTLLADVELVRGFLETYPDEIGMTKISNPHVFRYEGVNPQDWGVSGFVLIAESHIAVHTFVEHEQIWVDIFSCKGFEEEPVIDRILTTFEVADFRKNLLERGLEYPHNVADSVPINREERKKVARGV